MANKNNIPAARSDEVRKVLEEAAATGAISAEEAEQRYAAFVAGYLGKTAVKDRTVRLLTAPSTPSVHTVVEKGGVIMADEQTQPKPDPNVSPNPNPNPDGSPGFNTTGDVPSQPAENA